MTATTVFGSVTVGGATAYPVSASIMLPPPVSPASAACQLGIYDPADDAPGSFSGIQAFVTAGCPVKTGTYYMQWPQGSMASNWPANFAGLCKANGVIPFVEMEPWYTSTTWPAFTDITAGKYDQYLTAVAGSARAFGSPVYMTFAHEQNGSWYPWGTGGAENVTAAQWVAGWQHVVTVMSAIAPNIVWVWAPSNNDGGRAVTPTWPGEAYVGLAAWDGYLNAAGQTFASFLAPTLAEIRKLTSGPVWIAETGVEPAGSGRAARITGLISDFHAAGVNGFNWFNQSPFNLTAAELASFTAAVGAWNAA